MTTQEQEDKWRKEAEREFPYAIKEVAEIWPKTAEMLQALVDHQREAYIAGCRSRQAEIEALKKAIQVEHDAGLSEIKWANKQWDIDRESGIRREHELMKELEALREAAQKVCDTWAPIEHAKMVDEMSRLLPPQKDISV